MAGGALGSDQLTAVGDLGATILSGVPEAARAQVEPFIPALVDAIYEAFTMATASTFTVGIVTALLAAGLVLLLREVRQGASADAAEETPPGVEPAASLFPRHEAPAAPRSRSRTTTDAVDDAGEVETTSG